VDELRVVHAAIREEATQSQEAKAKVREYVAKAQEEAAKAREDLVPLLAHVKVLEEDVALVSGQRDALNIQIGVASARVGTLENEVTMLKGDGLREGRGSLGHRSGDRDVEGDDPRQGRGSSGGRESHEGLRDEVMGWQTHAEGKTFVMF
jgi:hypothetical protein